MLINPYPPDWKKALHNSLEDSEGFTYALVDGVHNEAFFPRLEKLACLHYRPLYASAPSADKETLGLGPILLQYSEHYRKQWDSLLEMTNGLPALSIIVSPESLDSLAARLIPWCIVDADDYTVALSFADTRILPALTGTLDLQQRQEFFGPATRWIYPGRDATWLALAVPCTPALPAAEKVLLTAQQVAALMAASEADSIAYEMSRYIDKPLAGKLPFESHLMIAQWLQVADQVRMEGIRDRLALCEFGLARPKLVADARYLALLEPGGGARTLDETLAFLS